MSRGRMAALALLTFGCACGDESARGSLDAGQPVDTGGGTGGVWTSVGGTGGDGAASGGTGGGSGGAGNAAGCAPEPLPPAVPPGWVEYTDYSCTCRFYVPGPNAAPLDLVEWEPCPQPGPLNVMCQRMKTPWTDGLAMGAFPKFWHDTKESRTYLQFDRYPSLSQRFRLVADANGPVRSALLELTPPDSGCGTNGVGMERGRYLYRVLGDSASGPIEGSEGFLGGEFGQPPSLVHKQPMEKHDHTTWVMTHDYIIRWKAGLHARRWDETSETKLTVAGQQPSNVQGIGATIFFQSGSITDGAIHAWTEAGGTVALVDYPGDHTKAVNGFATDGVDMVWTLGEGAYVSGGPGWDKSSIMTAPFSTDPAAVAKTSRRLRSDPGPFTPYRFAIGCGYAARQVVRQETSSSPSTKDLLVVRLSDGASWFVAMPPVTQGAGFTSYSLGITCDEVFATAHFDDESFTIVRIRLDSLGTSIAPD